VEVVEPEKPQKCVQDTFVNLLFAEFHRHRFLLRDVFNFEGRFHENSRLVVIFNPRDNISTFVFMDMGASCFKVYNEHDMNEEGLRSDSLCFWEVYGKTLCRPRC
jgi:hypothetical protein